MKELIHTFNDESKLPLRRANNNFVSNRLADVSNRCAMFFLAKFLSKFKKVKLQFFVKNLLLRDKHRESVKMVQVDAHP